MFFHIDESGNTGNNLFDQNQPKLSYGLLSSTKNVDVLAQELHQEILNKLNVDSIHANVLGVDKLTQVAKELFLIQEKMSFDFDYYFIHKSSFAITLFFDAVFDSGINKAVKWDHYWTPMRFLIIHKISVLFDDDLLKESWKLCTFKNIKKHEERIVSLLSTLLSRVDESIPDPRSKEIIADALKFGIANPLSLDFGSDEPDMIAPNTIGFQFVITAMARRLRKKRRKKHCQLLLTANINLIMLK